jgi:hypothetical protein
MESECEMAEEANYCVLIAQIAQLKYQNNLLTSEINELRLKTLGDQPTPKNTNKMIRVYSKDGYIKAVTVNTNNSVDNHESLLVEGWLHTATIDGGKWIEALMNGTPDNATDMMDELNFGPVCNSPVFEL